MSAYEHPDLVALDEVEDILEAYVDGRLTPSGPILSRMRAAVMTEAAAFAAARAAERRQIDLEQLAPRRGRFGLPQLTMRSLARPAFALGLAGLLAIGTGTAVTSATPGSPFYGARVALEDVFLPAEIDARLASHEQHLDERLAAAEAAADAGDAGALAAALAAYQDEIDQMLGDVGDDYGRLAHFQAVLEKHVATLVALSIRLPTEVARDNVGEHAIEAGERAVTKARDAVDKVKDKKASAGNRPSTPPRQDPDGAGGGTGGAGGDHPSNEGQNPDR